jgi:hypothetical protein
MEKEYVPEVGHRVRALLFGQSLMPDIPLSVDIDDTVEGEVITQDTRKGTITVRDGDCDWECYTAGAFPLACTIIVASRIARDGTGGAWEARFKGRATPMANGSTMDEAVQKLKFLFPSMVQEPVYIDERVDPALVGC